MSVRLMGDGIENPFPQAPPVTTLTPGEQAVVAPVGKLASGS